MEQVIMVACDLHDQTMLLKIAQGRGAAQTRTVRNAPAGRRGMIAQLRQQAQAAGGAEVVFAYEASGLGFGLYDELTAAGFRCHVLAPTKISRNPHQRRQKTDAKDAELILDVLRSHVLAGVPLPEVWVPDRATRDDREVVRMRLDLAHKLTAIKAQIKGLLKRNYLTTPEHLGKKWTRAYRAWLQQLSEQEPGELASGGRATLASLLRQLTFHEQEEWRVEEEVRRLAHSPRYLPAVYTLMRISGVGVLTAMVFLTEMGDLARFRNRRQVAAYLGLVPTSHESGQRDDCKGHITRQGPSRVRRLLCQAAWTRIRTDDQERATYERIVARNPKQKKKAVVAGMRRLAIRLWHAGQSPAALPALPEMLKKPRSPASPGKTPGLRGAASRRKTEVPRSG